jgi:TolA-binding protein
MPMINDKNDTISSLNSQVTNLQNQITSINSTINSLSSQVAELENQVISQISQLKQYLNATQTTAKVGKAIQIQSMYYSGTTLYVYVQNVGDSLVTLSNVYVNGVLDSAATFTNNNPLAVNQTSMVTTSLPAGFSPTNAVDVKVVCSDGTFMEASQLIPGS